MEGNELYKAKYDFLAECYIELMNHRVALGQSGKDSKALPESLAKRLDVGNLKRFSQYLEALNKDLDDKDLQRKLFEGAIKRLMNAAPPNKEVLRHLLLNPGYMFANEWGEDFEGEFLGVLYIFITSEGADPYVDLAIMKMCLALGKIVGRLKQQGYVQRDLPKTGGLSERKGYIDKQVYFDLFFSIDVGRKSPNNACKRIIEEATKREQVRAEAKNEKPKKVHSIKTIRYGILKEELYKLFS